MKYRIEEASYTGELTRKVQKLINEGWEPTGGPSYCNKDQTYFQDMVLDEPNGRRGMLDTSNLGPPG